MGKLRTAGLSTFLAVLAALAFSSPASAARDIKFGFVEDQHGDTVLFNGNASVRDMWWDRLEKSNADFIRLNMYWSLVARSTPAKATDPRDPNYEFGIYDQAVREAKERGIKVAFTVFLAPRWAEGANRDSDARIGTWKPNPADYGAFAQAVAKRYSGKFKGLPKVKYFEAWNEPNLPQYLTPQWKGKKSAAVPHYRKLLNAFYAGIHKSQKKAVVIGGGTSPRGDGPGGKRTRPYYFWRELLCLKHKKKLRKQKGCRGGKRPAHFDVYGQNPINAEKGAGPTSKPPNKDDGVPSNFHNLTKIVRAAEKRKTVFPKKKKHPGWATETWYESNPPDKRAGNSLKQQARYMQQVMYVLWKQKVKTLFFLQLKDSPWEPSQPRLLGFQTGIYLPNGKPKPSAKAVAFPFVADRKSKRKVVLWGIAPKKGKVQIKDGKKKVAKIKAKGGKVFTKTVRLKGKHKLQAKLGKKKSLPWKLKAK